MTADQIPTYFYPLFVGAFVVNAGYIGALYLLQHRLAGTPHAFNLFGGSPMDTFRVLGFVFSGRHSELSNDGTTQLVWLVRILFVGGLIGTLTVFAVAAGAI
jgi:hypothetical protein